MAVSGHRPESDLRMWEIWQSMTQLYSLIAADELGLFSRLKNQAKNVETLAIELGIELRAATAVAEYMTAMGLLDTRNKQYKLNEVSRAYLLPDSKHYWGKLFEPIKKHPLSYDMFINALKKNRSTIHGDNPFFEFISADITFARGSSYSFLCRGKYSAAELAKSKAFMNIRHLLDIGGGLGLFTANILKNNQGMKATIIELPIVCKLGEEYLKNEWSQQNIASRISFKSLDFFKEPWPTKADGIFFSDIFHDWSYETCCDIARKAFEALPDNGTVFLLEFLKDDERSSPWLVQSYNMAMMLYTEGQQFTFNDLKVILERVGFKDVTREHIGDIYTLIRSCK